ncbi:MAG: hypothetical protein LBD99_02750 [Candidatus Margulisbacteria bacterium]|jgi:hypothetical protein|nr:hypothetical protein [Candidatus Margulisiibacteriota bacterium]
MTHINNNEKTNFNHLGLGIYPLNGNNTSIPRSREEKDRSGLGMPIPSSYGGITPDIKLPERGITV